MSPQSSLFDYEPDLSPLTDAEREVYEAAGRASMGPASTPARQAARPVQSGVCSGGGREMNVTS